MVKPRWIPRLVLIPKSLSLSCFSVVMPWGDWSVCDMTASRTLYGQEAEPGVAAVVAELHRSPVALV